MPGTMVHLGCCAQKKRREHFESEATSYLSVIFEAPDVYQPDQLSFFRD